MGQTGGQRVGAGVMGDREQRPGGRGHGPRTRGKADRKKGGTWTKDKGAGEQEARRDTNQGPGGSGTGKAELTTTAPFFRPFFSTSRASVLFLLRKLHAVNPQIYFFSYFPSRTFSVFPLCTG